MLLNLEFWFYNNIYAKILFSTIQCLSLAFVQTSVSVYTAKELVSILM